MKKLFVLIIVVFFVIGIGSFAYAQQKPKFSDDITIVELQIKLATEIVNRLAAQHALAVIRLQEITEHYEMLLAEAREKAAAKKKAEKTPEKTKKGKP